MRNKPLLLEWKKTNVEFAEKCQMAHFCFLVCYNIKVDIAFGGHWMFC